LHGSSKFNKIEWALSDKESFPSTPVKQMMLSLKCSALFMIGKALVKKRKTSQTFIQDIVKNKCTTHLQMGCISAKEWIAQEHIKRQAAQESALEVEQF